jgi:hypothetical protein
MCLVVRAHNLLQHVCDVAADPSCRALAGMVVSNPAGGMDVVSVVCCQVQIFASG